MGCPRRRLRPWRERERIPLACLECRGFDDPAQWREVGATYGRGGRRWDARGFIVFIDRHFVASRGS